MWDRAQREATERCMSDWEHNLGEDRVKIPLVATSRVPNAVTLAYTARAVFTVGGSNCAPITCFISGPERGRELRTCGKVLFYRTGSHILQQIKNKISCFTAV